MKKNKILFVGSEATPFVKTGGLGDVVAALPKYLKKEGADVKLVLPLYAAVDRNKFHLSKLYDGCCVKMGNCEEWFSVYYAETPCHYDAYFIEFNKYFDRPMHAQHGLYDAWDTHQEYQDNAYRYAFFCRAALQLAKDLNYQPDIVHVHDWQTSLIPYYLKKDRDPFFENTKSVLTIHNLPYQGIYGADVIPYAKIDWADFNMNAFESFGRVNLLKGGIRFADKITTVSPHYAEEIMTPLGGAGLHWLLQERKNDVSGILNGIDLDLWNPDKDPRISYPYNVKTFKDGKARNKQILRESLGLYQHDCPLFSMVVRLTEQKGIHMFTECIEGVLNDMVCQFAIMGNGETWAQDYLASLSAKYSGQISVHIGFDAEKEHMMDAGSDFTIIPSIYEPCGLKQMYSQLYGTLPVARSTGGLADTIINYNEAEGTGTGFKFYDATPGALYNTIGWANSTYFDRPEHMDTMIRTAMQQDFSWKRSARAYLHLYNEIRG